MAIDAAVDITTMRAISSWFRPVPDPWAAECLCAWVDLTVNGERIAYGVPKVGTDGTPIFRVPELLRAAESGPEPLISRAPDNVAADSLRLRACLPA